MGGVLTVFFSEDVVGLVEVEVLDVAVMNILRITQNAGISSRCPWGLYLRSYAWGAT
ncbi:hypothetical protein HMPREF9622_01977 [Cutibacterium modestum HL037PA3]|nr:hypothetical protein HMPREF9622_01977 [Cutibacterium modestum HL037PA3]